jgi:F-type H+-transporting ATPase subunit delta
MASWISGRVTRSCKSLIDKKPRNYLTRLGEYQRLLRLESRSARHDRERERAQPDVARTSSTSQKPIRPDLATQFVVNPELLGGMRIRVGSDVWDSSVRNRLQRLQQQL